MITVKATDRTISAVPNHPITSGSVGLPVSFIFSDAWDGLTKIAVFKGSGTAKDVALLTDECVVPAEVLVEYGDLLWIGVYGANGDGDIVMPTMWCKAGLIVEGTAPSESDPADPTPNWVAQVQAAAASALEKAEAVEAAANNGDFDGFSPAVTITEITGGHRVNITDADHTSGQNFDVMDGTDGTDGVDGVSPTLASSDITGGHRITITDKNGTTTIDVMDGQDGEDGEDGNDGVSPTISSASITGGHRITIVDANGTTTVDVMDGATGATGETGQTGATGNGIASIAKTGTSGLVDTYTITYTNGSTTTFTVTNGQDGNDGTDGADGSKLITFTQLDATPTSSSSSSSSSEEFVSTAYTFRVTNANGTYCIEGSYNVATPTGYNLDAGTTTNKPALPVSITFAKQFQITCTNYSTHNTVLYGDAITANVWFDGLENLTNPKVFSIASTGVVSILPTTSGTVTVNGQTKNALHFSTNGLYYFGIYDEANGAALEAYLQTASSETLISGRVDCKTDEFADALSTNKALSVLYGGEYSYLQSHGDTSVTSSPIMAAFYGNDDDERYSLEFPIPTAKYLLIVGKKTAYAGGGGSSDTVVVVASMSGLTITADHTYAELATAAQADTPIVLLLTDGATEYVCTSCKVYASKISFDLKPQWVDVVGGGVTNLMSYRVDVSADGWEFWVSQSQLTPASIGAAAATAVPSAYTSTPAALGTASPGSSAKWAKGDHVHAMPSASDVGAAPAITEVAVSTAGAVTQALDAGKLYHFTGALTALTVTLNAAGTGVIPQYHFDFDSGAAAPTLTLPNTVTMPDGFTVEASKHYEVDILNGYGVVSAWATS